MEIRAISHTRRANALWLPWPGAALRAGIRDAVPAVLGLAPLGLVVGASASRGPDSAFVGWLTAPLLYGASSQFAALALLSSGVNGLPVLSTVAVIQARALFYSAALRPAFRAQPRWFRWFGPYLLVDPLFAMAEARASASPSATDLRRYYLGAGLAIWTTWMLVVGIGAAFGAAVPSGAALHYAAPASLVALLVPAIKTRDAAAAVAVAVFVAVLPGPGGGLQLLASGAAGALVGAVIERRQRTSSQP